MSTDFKDSFELFTTELISCAEVQLRKTDCAYKEQCYRFYEILEHFEEVANAENVTIVDQKLKEELADFKNLYLDITYKTNTAIYLQGYCDAYKLFRMVGILQ